MLKTDGDALECDLAQTYQIYDMRTFPLRRVAVFACGLGEESRIKRAMSGQRYPLSILIQAASLDALNSLIWANCKEGTPRPKSVFAQLTGSENEPDRADRDGACGFTDPEEFEKALISFRKEAENG